MILKVVENTRDNYNEYVIFWLFCFLVDGKGSLFEDKLMKASRLFPLSLIAPAILFVACHAQAALFSGGAATNISGDTDVLNTGALVGAFNVGDGGVGATTVNGVAFSPFAVNSGGGAVSNVTVGNFNLSTADVFLSDNTLYGSGSNPFASLSSSYQTLLRSATEVSNLVIDPATFNLTLSGLTMGTQYKFQWFASASGPGTALHASSAGSSITLSDNTTNLEGGLGQYAIGTFTADAASQVINFSSAGGANPTALINGFQLRDFGPVPEPTGVATAMLCMGVAALRRKRAGAVVRKA